MTNTILAPILAVGIGTGALAQEGNEPKILVLPTDCSAILNQEVSGRIYDIITCIGREFPENVRALGEYQRTTVGNTINEIGELLEGMLGREVVNDFDIPLTMDYDMGTMGKNDNGFYLLTQGVLGLSISDNYDCYASQSSMDGSKNITCKQGVDTSFLGDDFTCKRINNESLITYNTFYGQQSHTSKFNGTICGSEPLGESL